MTKRTEIEKLYETHFSDAVRLATMILEDTSSAEDVAQDAFLRSASRLGALRDRSSFPAYLRRAVVRTAISQIRGADRRTAREMRANRPHFTDVADPAGFDHLLQAVQRFRSANVRRWCFVTGSTCPSARSPRPCAAHPEQSNPTSPVH